MNIRVYISCLILFFVVTLHFSFLHGAEYVVRSLNNKIAAYFTLSDQKNASYRIEYSNTVIIQNSKLGIVREDGDFSKNLVLDSVSPVEMVTSEYDMHQGKKKKCSYMAKKCVFHLKNSSDQFMDIIFQVSNDGVAFRYIFPGSSDDVKKIKKEISSFHFLPGTKAYIQHIRHQYRSIQSLFD